MERRTFLIAAATCLPFIFRPAKSYASMDTTSDLSLITITSTNNKTVISDTSNGLSSEIVSNYDGSKTIVWSTGATSELLYSPDGDIYLDGTSTKVHQSSIDQYSVPNGYKLLKENRTQVSTYKPATDLAALIIGFVPVIGNAVAIAQYIKSLSADYSNAYMVITQYYHPNTQYIYTVVKLYKYSNYTGLLRTFEDGPRPPV